MLLDYMRTAPSSKGQHYTLPGDANLITTKTPIFLSNNVSLYFVLNKYYISLNFTINDPAQCILIFDYYAINNKTHNYAHPINVLLYSFTVSLERAYIDFSNKIIVDLARKLMDFLVIAYFFQ